MYFSKEDGEKKYTIKKSLMSLLLKKWQRCKKNWRKTLIQKYANTYVSPSNLIKLIKHRRESF